MEITGEELIAASPPPGLMGETRYVMLGTRHTGARCRESGFILINDNNS